MHKPLENIRSLEQLHDLESNLLTLGAALAGRGQLAPQPDAASVLLALAKALGVDLTVTCNCPDEPMCRKTPCDFGWVDGSGG